MKLRIISFTAAMVMLWVATATTWASDGKESTAQEPSAVQAIQNPVVELPELKYEFDPVVDGTQITHGFTVRNPGDAPLAITQVKTG